MRLFSYNKLKRATNGLKEQFGKGSFEAVYKRALYKGKRLVAVKRLEKLVEEGEREFRAEMRAIGRTHQRNLVRLLGYCAEDSKRLLVYEYMSNGSLANHLFKAQTSPNWNERVRIAQDIARGILYLHEECEASIIHCDIKPQNILVDDFWTTKISDFGLAKFLMANQTRTFTGVKGTKGYLAPEWQKNTPISIKVDVYSYGIVLLEIVCCRRNVELDVSNEEVVILSTWIYKCIDARLERTWLGGCCTRVRCGCPCVDAAFEFFFSRIHADAARFTPNQLRFAPNRLRFGSNQAVRTYRIVSAGDRYGRNRP